ncbi:cystathionine gamma-synthase [Tsuneonella sp. CC-YZS046]|uniref:cystathionine gamma-synthase n=1 Tax=Tsuneonella sp. CC-YZS046 TaxID=3042152 RepID=UPI002D78402A|nr:cystathionine gamma-synthase [Tsuneonella sp. CC-YZS046]WRO67108.1 cystathionine gamma-synthase [Tsuneonella sp. CC-YZS046]
MTDRDGPHPRPQTIAAAHGVATDPAFGAVAPPLYMSSTYEFAGYEQPRTYDYGRAGNPTRDLLAAALAKLEGGAGAVITSSGMSALDLLVGRLRPDDLVLAPHDCYGGTMRLLKARAARGHVSVRFVDQSDEAAFAAALEEVPALILIETPSNPLMRVVDIAALCARAREVGALVAVDNTFLSPAIQQPIRLGADYVVHSTTKYLNGHSDVIGGAVIAADAVQAGELRDWGNVVGSTGAPFDSWLTLRGLRTLFARMEHQQANAMAVARYLERHAAVSKVHYSGLAAHPGHAIALRQQRGFGAMLSFELAGGVAAVRQFIEAVKYFTLAESLGGVESLVAHPATMTHADMGEEARAAAGISDSLLRLSVGLEAEQDLIAGLEEGLAACGSE